MSELRRVAESALATPWAILPGKLEMIADVIAFHAAGGSLSKEDIRARVGEGGRKEPMQGQGVAVLPLYGVVGHRMNAMSEISGGTSTEQFASWFKAAMSDPAVGSIVIDVDSPGGTVQGVHELAELVYSARGVKPVVAIANSLMASAAYWVASAAEEVWATPSADVGSIGVYTMHQDLSEAYEKAGVKTTLISAGEYKTEGNPFGPLTDDARAAMQERVDEVADAFIGAVAKYRGVDLEAVREGYGKGRTLSATKAKRAGMIDRVGTMDTLLGRVGGTRGKLRAEDLVPVLHASHATGLVALALDGTADVAGVPVVLSPHATADEAKEQTMPDPGTVATPVADPAVVAAVQEKARINALMVLAADENVPSATVKAWIDGGATEASARRDLMAELKAKHTRTPGLSGAISPLDGGDNGTKHGPYVSLGEQLADVVAAGTPGARVSEKLFRVNEMYAAASGASATVGPDGGYLIQKDFSVDLMKEGKSGGVLSSACSSTEISANSDGLEVVYVNETSRATGSRWGGVRVYRRAEADTVTASKPQLDKWELRLEDLMGLAYITDRLSRDAAALGSVFSEAFRDEFAFTLDDEIFRGNGVGQCQGVLNAPALVTVAKESGQLADTIVAENIIKMWARAQPRSQSKGFWVYNTECQVQLQQMQIGTGTSAQLVYMPPGGLTAAPYGTIYGRPAVPIEHASALGDVGDIAFLDLSQYKLITKGGIVEDESIHVRFIYNEKTIRWNTSINGAPKLKSAITPYKGGSTLSPFVTLAARA